ncbi:hypothetical protein C0989_011171 [Termitomyces sp. Mn162]|nr:hypothetical protein C0989_011171 [Termitomyces sp. Mn162]
MILILLSEMDILGLIRALQIPGDTQGTEQTLPQTGLEKDLWIEETQDGEHQKVILCLLLYLCHTINPKFKEEEVEAQKEDYLFLAVDHCHPWEEVHWIQEDQMRALLVRKMVLDIEL